MMRISPRVLPTLLMLRSGFMTCSPANGIVLLVHMVLLITHTVLITAPTIILMKPHLVIPMVIPMDMVLTVTQRVGEVEVAVVVVVVIMTAGKNSLNKLCLQHPTWPALSVT